MTLAKIIKRERAGLKTPINRRLTIFVVALVGLFAVTCLAVMAEEHRRSDQRLAETVGFELATLSAASLADPLAARDLSAVEARLQALSKTTHIRAIELIDANGATVIARVGQVDADLGGSTVKAALGAGAVRNALTRDQLVLAAPVLHRDTVMAAVVISLSRASLAGPQTHRGLLIFALFVVMVALTAPLTVLYIRRTFEPLRALESYVNDLLHGEGEVLAKPAGLDEFQRIGQGVNALRERLESAQRRVRKLSFVDSVTELPNQERFNREVREQIEEMLPAGEIGAVLLFSLDRLDRIAETFGQAAAQELLAIAGQKLEKALRTADAHIRLASVDRHPALAARLPGHEFGVLVPRIGDSAEAHRYAQMLTAALNQPIEWRDQKITLGVAGGAAIVPRDAADVDTAMRHARLALNASRADQKGLRFFTPALDQDAHARMTLEREMREALERNEFRAYMQPKVCFTRNKIIGCEALARWVRPDRSMVSPGVFIPAAEETGLISQISEAILRDSCWKAAAWTREGLKAHVAVNVSPLQFDDDRFAQRVEKILDQSGLSANLLELEITESAAMTDMTKVMKMIEPLRAMGVRFAIDDFGTGHSSLAVLTRLPFDMIKIDQQFIRRLSEDSQAPTIVETILAMAASLNFETVAEGIETEEQARFLRLRGCAIGQGFLYGPALPAPDFVEMLRAQLGEPTSDLRGFAA
jgi:diguanylate cyclase (GGDEF)-like protein